MPEELKYEASLVKSGGKGDGRIGPNKRKTNEKLRKKKKTSKKVSWRRN